MGAFLNKVVGYSAQVEITPLPLALLQKNSTIKWSSRWDYVLEAIGDGQIQWFQIFNSLVIVLFMSGMIIMILLRTLHRDIARYNQEDVVSTRPIPGPPKIPFLSP